MYHIGLRKGDVGRIVLLPGDPDRVPAMARRLDRGRMLAKRREYSSCAGWVGKERVAAVSTGIGGPAAAIAVEELARIGAKLLVRVGTCGALRKDVPVGSLVIADASVRMEGTSGAYVPPGYPAAASPDVTLALADAAKALGKRHFVGLAASTDSFYAGQGRRSYGGFLPPGAESLVGALRDAGVLAFEMESATIFTLARVFGLKAGAVFAVVGNRATDEFKVEAGVSEAIEVAVEAVRRFRKFGA